MKKALKTLSKLIGALLSAAILALAVLLVLPLTENIHAAPKAGAADWMKDLPDDLSLSAVTLPGTHNSGTKNADLGFVMKCQGTDIATQLQSGYRYLDIRLRVAENGEDLAFCHDFALCRSHWLPWSEALTATDVLRDCYQFLTAHPTETILFAVKQDHGDEPTAEFQTVLASILRENRDLWCLSEEVPTVGEARGKLVLLRRYEDAAGLGADAGIALSWRDQGGSEDPTAALGPDTDRIGSRPLFVQDRYGYDRAEKWTAFEKAFSEKQLPEGGTRIAFLSTKGHFVFGHPYFFARDLNEKLLDRLNGPEKTEGWILLDFADPALAEAIYRQNFR